MSYDGGIDFGLLGDYDALHDLEAFGDMVEESLEELLVAAKKRRAWNGRAKPRPKRAAKKKPSAKAKALVAERELRVLGHLVRGPRRREDHRGHDLVTPSISLTNSMICSETCGPIGHAGVVRVNVTSTRPAVDLDPVDQAELDEVQAELRVDDVAERLGDLFLDRSSTLTE